MNDPTTQRTHNPSVTGSSPVRPTPSDLHVSTNPRTSEDGDYTQSYTRTQRAANAEALRAAAGRLDACLLGYHGGLLPMAAHRAIAQVVSDLEALANEFAGQR